MRVHGYYLSPESPPLSCHWKIVTLFYNNAMLATDLQNIGFSDQIEMPVFRRGPMSPFGYFENAAQAELYGMA